MTDDREWWEFCGICGDCKKLVEYGNHCCDGAWIDTSWQARVNPENTRWFPGYRFRIMQESKNPARRNSGRMRTRTYAVLMGIDRNGLLEFQGGVRPSKENLAMIEERYAQQRPGSNWYPGAE